MKKIMAKNNLELKAFVKCAKIRGEFENTLQSYKRIAKPEQRTKPAS